MSIKKPILLFLALGLPVAVFVFLKYFGRNEFAVPVLFEAGIETPVGCELFVYDVPYSIPDTILTKFAWSSSDSISLVVFSGRINAEHQEQSIQLDRIFTEFPTDNFKIIVLSESSRAEQTEFKNVRLVLVDWQQESSARSCVFLLKPTDNTVLLDSKKRIRGQYNITNREDVDRLIMEIKIVLKKY
jgi:hypothetical protein